MPNRIMTDLEILSHAEQMEALRAEFGRKFDWQWKAMREHGAPEREVIETQIEAWNRFRKTRMK